jgi:methionyl-tRNA formyltransferase
LHDRLSEDGARLILRVLDAIANGTATETPQDESQATTAPKLKREATQIDWSRPAPAIANQIRGLHPWPGCRVRLVDPAGTMTDRLTLVRARPAGNDGNDAEPGMILSTGAVSAGDGAVEVLECQPEGKRPMLLQQYRNGHRWDTGMRLESIL